MMREIVSFDSFMADVPDCRQAGKVAYPLNELLLLCLCAVISGCENFVDIAEYGAEKQEFLRELAAFEHGAPSHDTLSTVFRHLDGEAFSKAFIAWAETTRQRLGRGLGGVVAIDGKTVRGSKDRDGAALHLISAFCDDMAMVLGQRASSAKKNEIADIPQLLELLHIEGCIITIDAMGCQKAIAAKICDKNADYLLALKGNQGTLHEDVKLWFKDDEALACCAFCETFDNDKGRFETRKYWICDDIDWLVQRHPGWQGLKSIAMVCATRELNGKTSVQRRYYISSLPANAKTVANAVRGHWGIENRLHWVLDMVFGDDHCRVRKDNGPNNLCIIKHMAINLINKAKGKKSIRIMRKKAGWNNKLLKQILKS